MDATSLGLGFRLSDLTDRDGLIRLDRGFLASIETAAPDLHAALLAARAQPDAVTAAEESALLIGLGPHLQSFLGALFDIEAELAALVAVTVSLDPVHACRRLFVQRKAAKTYPDPAGFDGPALRRQLESAMGEALTEASFTAHVAQWELAKDSATHAQSVAEALDLALRYAAWASLTEEGQALHRGGILFHVPHRIEPAHLLPLETTERDGVTMLRLPERMQRPRDGFALTDKGMTSAQALAEMQYCIWCHHQGKDSCSKGLKDRKSGGFQRSALGVTLAGCPLEERISEMHELRAGGSLLGAFAAIIVDNPMLAATGHRICNDCMKACIYQKQQPVDIPQAETSILRDVLALPWGFEIYDLLTRWNPLDIRRPLPRPPSGRSVLIVGLGPAGFTLAHHLLNDGHEVVAVDGLKIEPLGFDPRQKVRDAEKLFEDLDDRAMAGFGGVAEYGITVRWNKNYLKLIRLLLERRDSFAAFGGVRFGGGATLDIDSAFALGFDHIALCLGAGRPTVLDIPNGLARGVREASDFLMALQLTGAAKKSSIANLQLRLPVVVIGGGLTAIDTATESLAYYVRQVEKFAARWRTLVREQGEVALRTGLNEEEAAIADEFLAHEAAIAAEREAAHAENRPPRFAPLLASWGGATIAYRRRLTDSPSYTLNHEEVGKALEEGVLFAEGLTPLAVEIDRFGHARGIRFRGEDGNEAVLPARAVLVAAGTSPNTVLAREDSRIALDGRFFQAIDAEGTPIPLARGEVKPVEAQILMHRTADGRFLSFFGDLHPGFAGNVVKAMASAKRGYPLISRLLATRAPARRADATISESEQNLAATVHAVHRLAPRIVEVVVHAPAAARAFRPGQFFRLQNYERHAARVNEPGLGASVLAMEGLAMTGASADPESGLVSVIVLEMGGSSDLCALLRPGEPVVLMGPTGTPTRIPENQTLLLAGGGLGNAVLFSIGRAARAAGSRVLYFAGYRTRADRYKREEIERAADTVVWCCDEAPGFNPNPARPQDRACVGNIVAAMTAYAEGRLGPQTIPLAEVDHLIAIGSDRMMRAVTEARHGPLRPFLKPGHVAIGSINSPMQCMMKEVCAQCLQPHIDPVSGERTVVFSCFDQDQPLDLVDFGALAERLAQNSLHEKTTARWIDRALRRLHARPAPVAAD
ncbi:MAG TPA: FAD-dependent oxidoreductase [Acetobacteraceae bacterium]|nr:FAD-dependent oxidoreductase [Acetobacteraceae bacterium]